MAELHKSAKRPETADPRPDPGSFEALLHSDTARCSMRMILTRWVAGVLVILATAFCVHVLHLPLQENQLYIAGAVILAYNTPLTFLCLQTQKLIGERQYRRVRLSLTIQVLLDWLSMSFFVHLTGGITSPAISFFLIHMLMVTILLPDQSPWPYVALAVGALASIAILEMTGVLPHYTVIPALPPILHSNPTYVGAQLVFFAIVAFGLVYLTVNIMQELRERERQVTTLLGTARTVSSTLDLQEVMDRLVYRAATALSAPGASIRLLDESGERLQIAAAFGLSQGYLGKGVVELSRSKVDQEALSGHAVIIPDVELDTRLQYPAEVAAEGIRSVLVVPLTGRGRALGVLRVYSSHLAAFSGDDSALVMAIAQQGATALQNAMAHDQLQRADQERAEFVRSVTHELRAPAASSQSLLRALTRGLAGELTVQQRDILGRIERRFDTLIDLINDLLALAASKASAQPETPEPLALGPIIEGIVDIWMIPAAEKKVVLHFAAPDSPVVVKATPDALTRIFDNLVGNAVKYTPPGGTVDVAIADTAGGVVVTVADTGIGIPEDDLANLWSEFFRARNARSSEITGTGLGLSIVKRLVERYGGMIGVQTAEGKGSTFSVRFPLAPANGEKH